MKLLRTSALRMKLSVVLSVPLIVGSLMWSSAALASCNFLSIFAPTGSGDGQVLTPRAIAIDPSDNVFFCRLRWG